MIKLEKMERHSDDSRMASPLVPTVEGASSQVASALPAGRAGSLCRETCPGPAANGSPWETGPRVAFVPDTWSSAPVLPELWKLRFN